VLDTLEHSSHLIILQHKLIWLSGDEGLYNYGIEKSNVEVCSDQEWCIRPNNFHKDLYPKLVKLQRSKNIQVICLAGDIGTKSNRFEYTSPEGIHFLATGVDEKRTDNLALLFTHDMKTKKLNWKFIEPSKLIAVQ